jgi:pimeloyl-ACP methyl ester carboxylesterase
VPRKTLILVLALAAGAATPSIRSTGKALLLLTEVVPSPVKPLQWTAEPKVSKVTLADGTADLYEGKPRMPGVVLVHGVAPGGPADPRMRSMATGLNRLGRTVLAPSLALGDQRLDRTDPARIRQAIEYLSDATGEKVMVLAFSFGAAFALVALEEEPAIQSKIVELATVGTYFDLVHLLQGVTAGRVNAPGGGTDEWRPDPRAGLAVTEFLANYLPGTQGQAVINAYKERDPEGLSPIARPIYDLMVNSDPARTRELVDRLPFGIGAILAELSPASRIDRITVPVRAMHSRQDPASPPSESQLLIESLRPSAQGGLTLVGSFRHVTPATGLGLLKDAGPLIGYTANVLQAQERWGYHL